jgi:hypothetical protein
MEDKGRIGEREDGQKVDGIMVVLDVLVGG